MAYVYDYSTRTQYVYVNGVLDQSNSIRGPYKGTAGELTIGTNAVCSPNNYWDGCLDQISYFARAKRYETDRVSRAELSTKLMLHPLLSVLLRYYGMLH